MKGYTYILLCSDDSYYTGSTKNLNLRIAQHQNGEGANHTKKRLPVKLIYYEVYNRIDGAYYRLQIQGWSRKKKKALIDGTPELLQSWLLLIVIYEMTHREPQGMTFESLRVQTFNSLRVRLIIKYSSNSPRAEVRSP